MSEVTEIGPRESLGLEAASNGKPEGARRFVSWVKSELELMAYTGGLPKDVAERMSELAREADRALHFLDGFIAGKPQANQ